MAARKKGNLELLPTIAIAEGDTGPDPGGAAAQGTRLYSSSTTPARLMEWTGTYWKFVPLVTVGTTAPTSPRLNDLWVDTN